MLLDASAKRAGDQIITQLKLEPCGICCCSGDHINTSRLICQGFAFILKKTRHYLNSISFCISNQKLPEHRAISTICTREYPSFRHVKTIEARIANSQRGGGDQGPQSPARRASSRTDAHQQERARSEAATCVCNRRGRCDQEKSQRRKEPAQTRALLRLVGTIPGHTARTRETATGLRP